jgi:hypothetical protein
MSENQNGATVIMLIRHAEKPHTYNGQTYDGVNATGTVCGKDAAEHLVTLGWERTGGLVSLFSAPWGPKEGLSTPQVLYAADPNSKSEAPDSESGSTGEGPSQRPCETLTALASKLRLQIDTKHSKKHYAKMVGDALKQPGAVLICWQHEDIPLQNADKRPGISQCILTQTGTKGTMDVPETWPTTTDGNARYDLIFAFYRPSGNGPITKFAVIPQFLLAGDQSWPLGT